MKEVLISVIVPAYKAADTIDVLLSDLVNQTYKNIEIIIINDGSTDNTQSIIDEYVKKDSRIISVVIENQGVSAARNVGVDLAKGKYLRFVDADDRVPVDSTRNLVDGMQQDSDIDLVIGAFKEKPQRQLYSGEDCQSGKVSVNQMAQNFVQYVRTFYYGVVWNKLYKREIIEKFQIRFSQEMSWCEDFLFNLDYYRHCKLINYLDSKQIIYEYIYRPDSITQSMNIEVDKCKQQKYDRIDNFRKEKASEFFEQFDLKKEFELEWKYKYLYYDIVGLGKPNKEEKIGARYKKLKKLLNEPDIVEYINYRAMTGYKVKRTWKSLDKVVRKKRYLSFFIYLTLRGYVAVYMNWLLPIWKSVMKNRKPKGL